MNELKVLKKMLSLIFISAVVRCDTVTKTAVFRPEEIHISKDSGQTYPTADAKISFTGESMCVKTDSQVELGDENQVKFKFIETDGDTPINDAFKKLEITDSNKKVAVKLTSGKTKSIIFTLNNAYKALVTGTSEDECYKNFLVTNAEKQKQFIHLMNIKCFLFTEVEDYKKTTTGADKYFVLGTKHLCFLPSLLTKPICLTITEKTKSYSIVISPYPEPTPKCTTPKSKTCDVPAANQSLNGTETAKQSATPIIISVVVIIVVIVAGGVGYVMMKK